MLLFRSPRRVVLKAKAPSKMEEVVDRLAPKLRQEFHAAAQAAQRRVDLAVLEAVIERGGKLHGLDAVIDAWADHLLDGVRKAAGDDGIKDSLSTAFVEGANAVGVCVPASMGLSSEAAKLYGGNFIDSRKISSVSEELLSGQTKNVGVKSGAADTHIAAARELIAAIREAPESNMTLYRGLSADQRIESLDKLAVGDVTTMGRISSFSESQNYAAMYADKGRYKYEIVLEGENKSVATDALTGQTHMERVTQGKFEVVRVETPMEQERIYYPPKFGERNRMKYDRRIVIRQVGVF